MTIRVRTIRDEERETLGQWERADGVVAYRHARVLLLSAQGWRCARIAEALGLHVQTVRDLMKAFNAGDLYMKGHAPEKKALLLSLVDSLTSP